MRKNKFLSLIMIALLLLSFSATTAIAADSVAISANKTTTLEIENFNAGLPASIKLGSSVNPENKTSGGDYLFTEWTAQPDVTISIPISVPKTNTYTIEYIGSYASWLSDTKIFLDSTDSTALLSTKEQVSTAKSLDGDAFYFHPNSKNPLVTDFPAYQYTFTAELPAGEHTLILQTVVRDEAYGAVCATAWDCVHFHPTVTPSADEVTVSSEGKTVLEYEDYAEFILTEDELYSGATILENNSYASGGKLLDMSERTTLEDAVIHLPIYVEKAGLYNLSHYITCASQGNYLSLCTLQIDGTTVLTNDDSYAKDLSYPNSEGTATYAKAYYPMAQYDTQVTLTEGSHIITLEAIPIKTLTHGAYGVKFIADCIEIAPYEEPVTEIAGETNIEIEDQKSNVYTTDGVSYPNGSIGANEKASGGKYYYIGYGHLEEAYIPIKLNVAVPGWYDIESVMHAKGTNAYVGNVHISIDDEEVLTNLNQYMVENLSEDNTFVDSSFKMHRFTNRIYLTEGEKFLKIYSPKTEADGKVKFYMDYIRFIPAKTIVSFTSNKAMIDAVYESPVSGLVIAAFYNDDQLAQITTKSVTEAQCIQLDAIVDATPDKVKVFLWDSLTNVKPLEKAITVTDFETRFPVLYLLGDSVCAEYGAKNYWQQGWGMHIAPHFDSSIEVINCAIGGKSSKTFRDNNIWSNLLAGIKYGDYVIINFGLNDIHPTVPSATSDGRGTTIEDYKMYLTTYCNEIAEKGATPILISTIPECYRSHTTLIPRANAMKEVAESVGCVFLNLNDTLNYQWILDENGNFDDAKAEETYNYYHLSEPAFRLIEEEFSCTVPESTWEYIATIADRTHINIYGAKHVAQTIVNLLSASDSSLKNFLK